MARMLWCLVGLLCLAGAANAAGPAGFGLSWNVMGGGGGTGVSPSHGMGGTIGQVAGTSSSTNYQLYAGFWVPEAAVPPPAKGKLNVSSVPDGADIILDGAATGKLTNGSFEYPAGPVTVSVAKHCYLEVSPEEVIVQPGKISEVSFELVPDPSCNAVPEFPNLVVPAACLAALAGLVFVVRRINS